MEKLVVLSHDLRVLCCHKGRLFAYPLPQFEAFSSLAFLCPDGVGGSFYTLQPASQWLDLQTRCFSRSVPRGWVKIIERASDQGIARLKVCYPSGGQGDYLFTKVSGEIGVSEKASREKNGAFRIITLEEFEALRDFAGSNWVYDKAHNPCSVNFSYSSIWDIYIDDIVFDGERSLGSIVKSLKYSRGFDVVLNNDNNIYNFKRFNPAVFYIIENQNELLAFYCSLKSFWNNFQFKCTIFIATYLKYEHVLSFVPVGLRHYIEFIPICQDDYIDHTLSHMSVLNSIDIEKFCPVIMLDSDILVTKPLLPYFIKSALDFYPCKDDSSLPYENKVFEDDYENFRDCPSIFPKGKVRGALVFLQNKTLLQTALFAYRAYVRKQDPAFEFKTEADFMSYLVSKYCLFSQRQPSGKKSFNEKDETLFMDVSSWSLDERQQYVERPGVL